GVLLALGPFAPAASQAATPIPAAHATRTFSLNETGSLHLTSKRGFTLNEQGTASGSVRAPIYVHLRIVSTTRVTAEVSLYPSGGSISGSATASYRREGSFARFSGSLSIDRGSGSYNRARGSGLGFSGTIQRSNDAVTVRVSGTASN
ncbi:MAG TPA: hypothetical protein VNU28_06595, partial [Solirubrobacteraceae bacterium]|nr:hypothetical protein [Solirubrobacteraceae bacterium]